MSGGEPRQVLGSSIVSLRWSPLRPAFLAAFAVSVIVVLGLHIVQPLPGLDVPDGYWPWPLGLMAYPVAAYLVLSRRPDNRIGHVLGLVASFSGLIFLSHWTAVTFSALSAASELLTWVGSRGPFGAFAALLHLFPTGHPAAVFRPLRTRTMRIVDRRFNRASYLAEQTRAAFAKQVRESLDQAAIVGALVDVVRTTLQPATSDLWFIASAEPQTGEEA